MGRWKEGLEDVDMRARRVMLDRLEWSGTPGGRLVSNSTPGNPGRSDAIVEEIDELLVDSPKLTLTDVD